MLYLGFDTALMMAFAVILCTAVILVMGVIDIDEDTGVVIIGSVAATAASMVMFYMAMCIFL